MTEQSPTRRKVLRSIGAAGALSLLPRQALGASKTEVGTPLKNLGPYKEATVEEMSAIYQRRPNTDQFAISTGAFGNGIEFYLVSGAPSPQKSPKEVIPLTNSSEIGVFAPQWRGESEIEYTQDYKRKVANVSADNNLEDPTIVDKDVSQSDGEFSTMLSVPFPIPSSLPIDLCTPMPNGNQICIQTGKIIDNFGQPRDCRDGESAPVVSVDVKITEKESFGAGDVVASVSPWIGLETDGSAVWVGEEISGECTRYPIKIQDFTAAPADLVDQLGEVSGDIVEKLGYSRNNGVLVAAVAVVIALLIAAPPTGVPA
ncbi:hypothetical protein GCM10009037_30720 [Halarchaeum grantii]|uniref:Uncharacterized protein n=1 Tax=Halarchaeum grantii TaxID=1193105 RepID=A0A830FEC6_9EURY|nr:hypothetical protein [Halarchaeum grantii]GGL45171.1 hypothetical protein GCM10009037_30720 [Halarchaeum grantii]